MRSFPSHGSFKSLGLCNRDLTGTPLLFGKDRYVTFQIKHGIVYAVVGGILKLLLFKDKYLCI